MAWGPRFYCGLCYSPAVCFGSVSVPLRNHKPIDLARSPLSQPQHSTEEGMSSEWGRLPWGRRMTHSRAEHLDSCLSALSSLLLVCPGCLPWRLGVSLRRGEETRGDRRERGDSGRRRRREGQARPGYGSLGWESERVRVSQASGRPFPPPLGPMGCHLWMLIIHDAGALPGFNAL